MNHNHITITRKEFDNLCKAEKGWVRNRCGYEYVYDYRLPNTNVMIKILSSVQIEEEKKSNKHSNVIRVFAVIVDNNNNVKCGMIKAITVYCVEGWQDKTIQAYKDIVNSVRERIQNRKNYDRN